MQSFTRDKRLRPFTWGVKLGSFVALVYLVVLLTAYYGYITIDPTKVATIYPGFTTDPVGLGIGFLWMSLEGFAVGYILGMLSLARPKYFGKDSSE